MKKHKDIRVGDALTTSELRFVVLVNRMIHELGRGPSVSEVEARWHGSRSGIVETAHACRAKGYLAWGDASGSGTWATMKVVRLPESSP